MKGVLSKFFGIEMGDSQVEAIKRETEKESLKTSQKIEILNMVIERTVTYHIARAIGILP